MTNTSVALAPRKKILLADDHENVRRLITATLGETDFDLMCAGDGEQALALALSAQPDLVLLDVNMPKRNGFDVCRAIRDRLPSPRIKVLMLTAVSEDELREEGARCGADDFIMKPFSPLMLLRKIQTLLNVDGSLPSGPAPKSSVGDGRAGAKIIPFPSNGFVPTDRALLEEKVRELEASQQQMLIYAEELNHAYRELQSTYFSTLEALASAIDARDPFTYGHSKRVAAYAVEIAKSLNLQRDKIETIRRAALLHDIGKIGLPDAILLKPGKLEQAEWEQMKRHPEIGYAMVSGLRFLADAAPFIRGHHERWDGRGYPDGLRGDAIPLGARILAVADSFDAMTSNRLYRPALSLEQARREADKGRSTQFDPMVVDAFNAAIGAITTILRQGSSAS